MPPAELCSKLLSALQMVEEQKYNLVCRLQSTNQIISQKNAELLRVNIDEQVMADLEKTKELLNLEQQMIIPRLESTNQIISEKDNQRIRGLLSSIIF